MKGDFLMTYDNASPILRLASRFGLDTHLILMMNTHHEIMNELLIGRDLAWARNPLELVDDSLLEYAKANGNASR